MANIKPFPAVRPSPELASRICELPYDVFTAKEARAQAAGNPLSFLHVSRPEIDLSGTVAPGDDLVYQTGRANFLALLKQEALKPDAQPCFYLYRQKMGVHTQTGLVAVASCNDYRDGVIRKHESTHPDKVEDRARHIEALDAQTGPAFLIYPSNANLNDVIAIQTAEPPDIHFTSSDGVEHTTWMVSDPRLIRFVELVFSRISTLYIADGHHRSAAALMVSNRRQGRGYSNYFLCVLFPHDQVQVLAYHRLVKDLNGFTPSELLQHLGSVFQVRARDEAQPAHPHEVCLYLDHQWHALDFRPELVLNEEPVDQLDVSLLQNLVLAPMFDIDDPRTNPRIGFSGGVRGTGELVRLVDSGQYACAFALYPTRVQQLFAISDMGKLMPPKSTWFEPKLRDGLFSHLLSESNPIS
jgi:uncharacterized protein (DUF1015 family)